MGLSRSNVIYGGNMEGSTGSHHALAEWPKEAVSYDKDQLIRVQGYNHV